MLRIIVTATLLLGATATAHAGACMEEAEFTDSVRALEALAKNPKADLSAQGFDTWDICLRLGVDQEQRPKLVPRVLTACTTILKRDPHDHMCAEMAARLHKAELAGVDIYGELTSWKIDPFEHEMVGITSAFEPLGDPRAAPFLVAMWKANLAEADKRKKRRPAMDGWQKWRTDAAKVIGALGGEAEKVFLDEQALATKDKFLKKACQKASAQIAARSSGGSRTLDNFKSLRKEMTIEAAQAIVGAPDSDIGSGIHVFAYKLADGSRVLVGTADKKTLLYVKHEANGKTVDLLR